MQESTPVLVGIDVGGTKTHLRALAGGTLVADRVRTSGGWRPHDPVAAAGWLAGLVTDALPAGVRPSALAVGGHACETPRQCAEIRTVLRAHVDVPALVVGDAELLVPAAAGLDRGVGLVAGTGSVAVGRRADGTLVQVGGWGALLGDEGGAAGLAREAVRACWGAHDRGEAPDALAAALLDAFGAPEVPALGGALESAADPSAEWGRRAPAVFAAATAGSALARTVIAAQGRALAALVALLAGRGAAADDVVVAGGTVLAQPLLYDAFAAALAETLPASRPRPLRVPPVDGAVALARSLL
ncbi:ATPase [Streptomyces sp. IMTB 2501]|uniref:BadF/BadG/BcrA/BcrD ATPase family protein n=1 Tax=Streptomyces sp. IMTB 2501 TaxID=1776340 RepID=UPI00096CF423|nr:BadF/BadG/BcrA/BcrD ATPase family protein [Streptomyces sp. IMTB 2501]OLZ74545.1 ATPase [Streptomyces sp. IMTB 2501]